MKKYYVLDWYEDLFNPDFIGDYDTVEEAEKACDDFEADTDGECDLVIYNRDNPIYEAFKRFVK